MKECPVCKKQFGFFAGAFGKFQAHVDDCKPAAKPYKPLTFIPGSNAKRVVEERRTVDDGFSTSMALGAVTGDPLVSTLVGGNVAGALIGSSMHDNSHHNNFSGHGGDLGGGGASSSWDSGSSSSCDSSSSSCGCD